MPNDFFFARRRPTTSGVAFLAFFASAAGVCPAGWQAGRRKLQTNSAGHIQRNHCFLATELQGCNEVLLCSARGRPLAPACADAWRERSNALHSANDTDVANSFEHALRNHPEKSPSQGAEAERRVASRLALGMVGGRLGVDHLALAIWRHLLETPSSFMQQFRYCLGMTDGW